MIDKKRIISLDILRSVGILLAILVHYNPIYVHELARTIISFIQFYYISIGGLFIFISGLLFFLRYSRAGRDIFSDSLYLFRKAFQLLAVYVLIIFSLRLFIFGKADSLSEFLFSAPLYIRIIFVFFEILLLSPIFLFIIRSKHYKAYYSLVLAFVFSLVNFFLSEYFLESNNFNLLINRQLFLYALLPVLSIFFAGVFSGWIYEQRVIQKDRGVFLCLLFTSIFATIFRYKFAVNNTDYFSEIFESINMVALFFSLELVLGSFVFRMPRFVKAFLLIGKHSLITFLGSNVMIAFYLYKFNGLNEWLALLLIFILTFILAILYPRLRKKLIVFCQHPRR